MLLLSGTASAQESVPASRPPPLQRPVQAGLSAMGGMDAWTGGGGPAVELRAATTVSHRAIGVWWGSTAEAIGATEGALVLDDHRAGLVWSGGGPWSPLVGARVSGAAYAPWGAAEALVGVGRRLHPDWRAGLDLGAGARWVVSDLAPQVSSGLYLERVGTFGLLTRVGATAWTAPLPPISLRAEQWVTLGGRARLEAGAAITVVPDSAVAPVIGIPAPGAAVVQGLAAGALQATDRLAIRIEVAPEGGVGVAAYGRARALVGVEVGLGGRMPEAPRVRAGPVATTRFELRAPDADEVSLVAEFTEWKPVAMSRIAGGRWTVEVPVSPGRWSFGYQVDGTFVTPPAADAWEPDGFGGTNGILVVDESLATASR